jgi:hypothetical protein
MNQTVTAKDGTVIKLCSYRWTGPDGHVEMCRHTAGCSVCGQCSRLDKDHENGHCTGHLGLSEHIPGIPGTDQRKVRDGLDRKQNEIHRQRRPDKDRQPRRRRPQGKGAGR